MKRIENMTSTLRWSEIARDVNAKNPKSTRPWCVRFADGAELQVASLLQLGRMVNNGLIEPDAEISRSNGSWSRIADVIDLRAFGATLVALGHLAA